MRKEKGYRILAEGVKVSNNTLETYLNNNDLIIGSSGAGKTGGYVIPNIQNISGSLVVSDTKGQLYKKFSKELEDKGYDVKVLDLVNPERSCGYNPLSHVRRYSDGSFREQDVLSLANSLIQDVAGNDDPIWHLSARSYLAFLICYCLENLPEAEHNMVSICDLNHAFSTPSGELAFVDWVRNNPQSFASKKYREIKANKQAERMWASILGFANVALEPFEFKEAAYIFNGTNNIDIKDLGKKKMVLFLNVADTDRTFDSLVNIFYYQALQNLCSLADDQPDGRLKVPVRIIMDDFATSARITDFDKIISVIRSRGISVSIILQSLTQLGSMYKDAKDTIIDNCDHVLYLGSQNQETAEFVGTRAYKTPEKILCMPRGYEYILTKGEEAKLVKKVVPYSTVK
ncbi:MAG: type IV secretory system conjugative DNA transfer family protein [Lachnospiraceae bacterium]|nr:type IV secretory system conjugative DNA transfer family protein [Lachnospiraceae bacterium]